jgi:hypothetical protein
MKSFNLNMLVSVEVRDKELSNYYEWRPAKSYLLGLVKETPGFYSKLFGTILSYDDLEQLYVVEYFPGDVKKLFHKPYVTLTFAGSKECTRRFSTLTQAKEFVEDVKAMAVNCKWLES